MKTFQRYLAAIIILLAAGTQTAGAQGYTVDTIAYQPYSFTGGHPVLVRQDDLWSQVVPIGFNFNFYGASYSNLVVGSNGNISFNTAYAGMSDPWAFNGNSIPSVLLPLNSIFGAYRDIDNTNIGSITYQLMGSAPHRVFVVNYDSVPLYGSPHSVSHTQAIDSSLSVFQIVLYEGCNAIEVYIHHSPSDHGWNSGLGLIGIQDSIGASALAVPGYNVTAWTANDKAWRFSINGSNPCSRSNAGQDQTLCANYIATMQAIGTGTWSASPSNPATVTIVDPSSPNTTVSGFSAIGGYVLTWSTATDTSSIMVTVVACSDSVWPGDADYNGIVNNDDLLPIGLGYDSTGPARPVQGIVWQADAATPWAHDFLSYVPSVNYRYADCNGDGVIDSLDVSAINQNYSLLHFKTNGPAPYRSGLPTLYAVASADSLHPGDSLTVHFVLADSVLPVYDFYGMAFTYHYDASLVDSAATSMTYTNSWIGGTDKISMARIQHGTGEIQTAVSRITHSARYGQGAIGYATFKVRSDLSVQALPAIINAGYISDLHAVNPAGGEVALNTSADTTFIAAVAPLGIAETAAAAISLHPNPANDKITITADDIITGIAITDAIGKEAITTKEFNGHTVSVNVSGFSSGLYFVQVKTIHGSGVSKFVVEKGQ